MSNSKSSEVKSILHRLGWDVNSQSKRIEDVLKNKKISSNLLVIGKCISEKSDDQIKDLGILLFDVAGRFSAQTVSVYETIVNWIVDGKVKGPQLEAITEIIKKNPNADETILENECGIGIFVNPKQISETISKLISSRIDELKEKRYQMVSTFHDELKISLKWADKATVNKELNSQIVSIIGPKGENEIQKKSLKKPKEKSGEAELNAKKNESNKKNVVSTNPSADRSGENCARIQDSIFFPDPCENAQISTEILENHLKATNGVVITRFPPEPNGYLHIGHAKAMNLNFGYAEKKNGICYLRFDDTNPSAETSEYIDSILDTVEWLGNKPYKITYASEYFDRLYECAVELIKLGKAYVCHQQPEEYRNQKNSSARNSPWRDRAVEENIALFEDMKNGKFKEGQATLRMKMDLESRNPCMWDLVAYRIKYHPHPHVGEKWCIYPSYDFTHCVNDSFENITHSLCTLEYVTRRESYYWLLDALKIYRPLVWEYSRLNLTHTILSKRVLNKLINSKIVRGWDDPRMPTISGYRRRGYTANAINKFCEDIGVTRSDNVYVPIERLEQCLRDDLDSKAIRAMAVLEPLKVVLENFDFDTKEISRENIPGFPQKGQNKVILTSVIYVERSDFRENDLENYRGLALNTKNNAPKWVRLKYGPAISIKSIVKDENGKILKLNAIVDYELKKTSGTIHWVSARKNQSENVVETTDDFDEDLDRFSLFPPQDAEFRLYGHLFNSLKPAELEDKLHDVNPNSEIIVRGFIDPTAVDFKVHDNIQFERLGYFAVDIDSTLHKPVFNRSVCLKEAKDRPK